MKQENNLTPIFIVTTCSGRENYVQYLQAEIPNLIVNYDDFIDSKEFKSTAYWNYKRSLDLANGNPTVQLDDDIILCNNFYNKILYQINRRPKNVIQFFSMRKADQIIGSRYELGSKFLMQQCYYLPLGMATEVSKEYQIFYNNADFSQNYHSPSDVAMAGYLKKNKIKYWNYCPSLVQHRECKSRINSKRSSKRQSKTFH